MDTVWFGFGALRRRLGDVKRELRALPSIHPSIQPAIAKYTAARAQPTWGLAMAGLPPSLQLSQRQTPVPGQRPPSSAPLPQGGNTLSHAPNTAPFAAAPQQPFHPLAYPTSPPPTWSATHHRPSQSHANLPYPSDEGAFFPAPLSGSKERGSYTPSNDQFSYCGGRSQPPDAAAAFAAIPLSLLPGSPPTTRPHSASLGQPSRETTPAGTTTFSQQQRPHGYSQPPRPLGSSRTPPSSGGSPQRRPPSSDRTQSPAPAAYTPPHASWAAAVEQAEKDAALQRPGTSQGHSLSTGSVPLASEPIGTQLLYELDSRPQEEKQQEERPQLQQPPQTEQSQSLPRPAGMTRLGSQRGIIRAGTPSTIVTNEYGVAAPVKSAQAELGNEHKDALSNSQEHSPSSAKSGRARAASDIGNQFGIKPNPWVSTPLARTPAPNALSNLTRQPSRAMKRQLAQELETHMENLETNNARKAENDIDDNPKEDEEPELLSAASRTSTNDERTLALLDLYFAAPEDRPGLVRSITKSVKARSRNKTEEHSQLALLVSQLRSPTNEYSDEDEEPLHSASSMYSAADIQHPWEDVLPTAQDAQDRSHDTIFYPTEEELTEAQGSTRASSQSTPRETPSFPPTQNDLVPEPLSVAASTSTSAVTSTPLSGGSPPGSAQQQPHHTPRSSISSVSSTKSQRPQLMLKTTPSKLQRKRPAQLNQVQPASLGNMAREDTLQKQYAQYKAQYADTGPKSTPAATTTSSKSTGRKPRRQPSYDYEGRGYGGDDYGDESYADNDYEGKDYGGDSLSDSNVSEPPEPEEFDAPTVQPSPTPQRQDNPALKGVSVADNALSYIESRHPEVQWAHSNSSNNVLQSEQAGPVELPSREYVPPGKSDEEDESDLNGRNARRAQWDADREAARLAEEEEIRAEVAAAAARRSDKNRRSADQKAQNPYQRTGSRDQQQPQNPYPRPSSRDHQQPQQQPHPSPDHRAQIYQSSYGSDYRQEAYHSQDYRQPSYGSDYRQPPPTPPKEPLNPPLRRQRSGSTSDALGAPPAQWQPSNWQPSQRPPQDPYLRPEARGHQRSKSDTHSASLSNSSSLQNPSTTALQHQGRRAPSNVEAQIAAAVGRIEAARAEMRRREEEDERRDRDKKGRGFRQLGLEKIEKFEDRVGRILS